jgi:hypothetical protein
MNALMPFLCVASAAPLQADGDQLQPGGRYRNQGSVRCLHLRSTLRG